MNKHNFFVIFLKKISLSLNSLLKKNLNKLNFNNLFNIARSDKIFLIIVALILLFLSYLSIPNIHNKTDIQDELRRQLLNKLNLNFNFSEKLEYNFFPRPHFIAKNSIILDDKIEIAKIKNLKIYISLNNLFSLENMKVKNLIIENANFNINSQNDNFFIKLLDRDFSNSDLIIKNSNIFYRNIDKEVLFINKIIKMRYHYNVKDLKNVSVSENEIFNIPYLFELHNNKEEKKLLSKININFLKMKIENEIDYEGDIILGFINLIVNKKKSRAIYEIKKNSFEFKFFDKLNDPNFTYKGSFNLRPFYSSLIGIEEEINFYSLFNSNGILAQLLKSEVLYNKNLYFDLTINGNKIHNHSSFVNIFLNSKIQEGLIDFDDTKFSWKNYANFKISNSLIYVKDSELIIDGKLDLSIDDYQKIFKFLLTPKNYRTNIKKIDLNFNYNFDQKTLSMSDIKIDNKINKKIDSFFKNIIFRSDKLQNKIYLKKILNEAIKIYAG